MKIEQTELEQASAVQAAREAIVRAAEHLRVLNQRTISLIQQAEQRWMETRVTRRLLAREIKRASKRVVGFRNDVQVRIKHKDTARAK